MFEKEAEDYANKKEIERNNLECIVVVNHEVSRSFKDGAEFGYNKANEWHYVKGGDLPKETGLLMSITLLLITKMKGSDCLFLALGEYNFSTQEFNYQHFVGLTDVVAWKEIVPPKEIE